MYPLGVLFGLGFDTASEVALLGLAATSGANHVPIVFILVLPALFAAGMSLVDATDGILMLGAYGWAYVKPIRKLYYNLNITLVSVLIAFADRRHRGPEHRRRALRPARRPLGLRRRASTSGSSASGSSRSSSLSWALSTLIYRWKRLRRPAGRRLGGRRPLTATRGRSRPSGDRKVSASRPGSAPVLAQPRVGQPWQHPGPRALQDRTAVDPTSRRKARPTVVGSTAHDRHATEVNA